ncbi:ABC transporter substrate-binding protein [Butyrivibrio proteoclasticus]|uniref:ABC transporter substrate-binding protein n=1 Tax=Butyrivibrio proteoclasticus TaxID=43305 RepID=UPI00047D7DB6|nr:ABC transporter substrate-binding protein [Butyrivibrio proteoclasticus]
MKKLTATIMTGLMATSLLAGCGGTTTETTQNTDSQPSSEKTTEAAPAADQQADSGSADSYESCTLTFDWWGGDARHEATIAAIEAFEAKYPGITIEYNYGAWSDWETAKASEYLSGTNPDVQQVNADWIGKYDADCTTYLDLNTVSDVLDLTQYDASTLAFTQDSKGGQAAIPIALTGRTFYWNKATFEAAGLSTPTTLAELEAAGPIFKEKLGDNYYPLVLTEYDRAIMLAFYTQAQTGEPIIDQNGNFTLTQDQVKDALTWITSLEENHVIPTIEYYDGEGAESIDKSARWIGGEYAGCFTWDSSPSSLQNALPNPDDFEVGCELMDTGKAGSGCYVKVSQMFAISAKTEHPHEAALFLNYILNDEEGAKLMGTQRGIPESKAAYAVCEAEGAIDPVVAAAHKSVMDSNPMYWNPLFDDSSLKGDTAVYNTLFENLSYGVRDGSYSIDDAAQDLYDAYVAVAPAK